MTAIFLYLTHISDHYLTFVFRREYGMAGIQVFFLHLVYGEKHEAIPEQLEY